MSVCPPPLPSAPSCGSARWRSSKRPKPHSAPDSRLPPPSTGGVEPQLAGALPARIDPVTETGPPLLMSSPPPPVVAVLPATVTRVSWAVTAPFEMPAPCEAVFAVIVLSLMLSVPGAGPATLYSPPPCVAVL